MAEIKKGLRIGRLLLLGLWKSGCFLYLQAFPQWTDSCNWNMGLSSTEQLVASLVPVVFTLLVASTSSSPLGISRGWVLQYGPKFISSAAAICLSHPHSYTTTQYCAHPYQLRSR